MTGALVVWCPPDPSACWHPLVTPGDRVRAGRFLRSVDAHRHLTGRVIARRAGASWLGIDPADVQVGREDEGRPLLVGADGDRWPAHVSITHAGDVVGVAVADTPVGIDVQDTVAISGLVDSVHIWTPGEIADLDGLAPHDQQSTAAQWWTAKEAVLKSRGRGLLDPVETLDVRNSPVPWYRLEVGTDHAASIAGAAPGRVVRLCAVHEPIDG